jgi:hypothetical protein
MLAALKQEATRLFALAAVFLAFVAWGALLSARDANRQADAAKIELKARDKEDRAADKAERVAETERGRVQIVYREVMRDVTTAGPFPQECKDHPA